MAEIIAANSSAALLFGDPVAAQETLGFLQSQQHIQAAAIYEMNNAVFASYRKPGVNIKLPEIESSRRIPCSGVIMSNCSLHIEYEGEQIGVVYLRSNMKASTRPPGMVSRDRGRSTAGITTGHLYTQHPPATHYHRPVARPFCHCTPDTEMKKIIPCVLAEKAGMNLAA